jgi:hypothetical protein
MEDFSGEDIRIHPWIGVSLGWIITKTRESWGGIVQTVLPDISDSPLRITGSGRQSLSKTSTETDSGTE